MDLWLTADVATADVHHTRGCLRHGLAETIRCQVENLIAVPEGRTFPTVVNATKVVWAPLAPDRVWDVPGLPSRRPDAESFESLMRSVLRTLVRGRFPLTASVTRWLADHVHRTPSDVEEENVQAQLSLDARHRVAVRREQQRQEDAQIRTDQADL